MKKLTWTRIEDGYQRGDAQVFDNGAGMGPAKGGGRWAVVYAGKWIANLDTLAEAKKRGEQLTTVMTGTPMILDTRKGQIL